MGIDISSLAHQNNFIFPQEASTIEIKHFMQFLIFCKKTSSRIGQLKLWISRGGGGLPVIDSPPLGENPDLFAESK